MNQKNRSYPARLSEPTNYEETCKYCLHRVRGNLCTAKRCFLSGSAWPESMMRKPLLGGTTQHMGCNYER